MAKINVRNRNRGKYYKDGRPKPPNWEYRFEAAKVDGKRNQISNAGYSTKKEAELAGSKALAEYNNAGRLFSPSEISVSDYFDYWVKNYCETNLSDNTTYTYNTVIQKYIKPAIGLYKLKAIETMTIQEFINEICVEKGFSKEYNNTILKVLKQGFKYAQKTAKFISANPAEDVSLPNMDVLNEEEIIVLSKKDVAAILDRFKRSPYQYYPILIAYYTGLRVSEVYGLTWEDIDFDKKTLTVNKIAKKFDYNARKNKNHKLRKGHVEAIWYLGACKTPSSYRTIQIGDTLLNALMDYKELQEQYKKTYGEYYYKTYVKEELTPNGRKVKRIVQTTDAVAPDVKLDQVDLICVKDNGEFRGTSAMRYPSKVINYEMGINFNFHALRHTHATMLIEQGHPIKAVSERLGHSNSKITWDVYVKVTEKMENDVVDTFEVEGGLKLRDEELYALWRGIHARCKNTAYYKQRNIKVCEEWQEYETFEKWANENGWSSGLSILRKDKKMDYEPDNCMFGTENKSVKGDFIYADGVNMKSYSVKKIGRGYGYRVSTHDEDGKRREVTKAGFETENAAALAAEALICEMFAQKALQTEAVPLRLVK